MRSAIYYPRTEVRSHSLMQSSLLLWDTLHTIVPFSEYSPDFKNNKEMASAWELIGKNLVTDEIQKSLAHKAIEEVLQTEIPQKTAYLSAVDRPNDIYEIWPQKFAIETFYMMQAHGLTGNLLPNGDYPFSEEGGLLVMAKLADACAGTTFARVTDRLLAYGLIADSGAVPSAETDVIPLTLEVIDETSIPIKKLIAFRRREQKERDGHHYTQLRHAYLDAIHAHVEDIKKVKTRLEVDEKNREFKNNMSSDIRLLREELRINKAELFLKPIVVGGLVGAGSFLASAAAGPGFLLAAGAAACSTSLIDNAKHIAELFSSGIGFSRKQKEAMAKHPMAYMYALAKT